MHYEHLSLVYHNGGFGALVRIGANSDEICQILYEARREAGITLEEEEIAYQAVEDSEKSRHGKIVRLPHEKYQAALDYCLFSFMSTLVFTPSKAYFRGSDDEIEILKQQFHCVREHDEIWRIEGDFDAIREAFLKMTG